MASCCNKPRCARSSKSKEVLARLKQTQAEYTTSFGVDFDTPKYFEDRLPIGLIHAQIELPVHLYLGAYSKMQTLLQQAIFNSSLSENSEMSAKCFGTTTKIILLDVSLALDSYTHKAVNRLTESVHNLESAKDNLANQLMHDGLTGTLSRAYILDVLKKKPAQTKRNPDLTFSLAMLDIDSFKQINDT